MRPSILLCSIALLAAGCHRQQQGVEQNAIANAPTDIETLPPDESDSTPTNELINGVDQPNGNTIDLNSN